MSGGELHQIVSHSGRIMTRRSGLFQIITKDCDYSQSFDRVQIIQNLARTFQRILGLHFFGSRCAVDERKVKELFLGMAIQCADVVRGGKIKTFVGLGHQVTDVYLGRVRVHDRL